MTTVNEQDLWPEPPDDDPCVHGESEADDGTPGAVDPPQAAPTP